MLRQQRNLQLARSFYLLRGALFKAQSNAVNETQSETNKAALLE